MFTMFKNFKNCVTTNLISLFGYLIFIASVIFLLIIYPKCLNYQIKYKTAAHSIADTAFFCFMFIIFCIYIFLFILFICYFIERHLQNSGRIKPLKILENFNKPKTIVFWLGYFLIFSPIYYILVLLIWLFIALP